MNFHFPRENTGRKGGTGFEDVEHEINIKF